GSFQCKISQLGNAICKLFPFLQRVKAILIFLRPGIVQSIQRSRETVENLRVIRVRLDRSFPVVDRFIGLSQFLQILTQEKLCIGVIRLESNKLLQKFCCPTEVVGMSYVERTDV